MRIPLMLFSLEKFRKMAHRYMGFGRLLRPLSPGLGMDLIRAELDISPDEYRTASLSSALFFGAVFWALISAALFSLTHELRPSVYLGFLGGLAPFFMILIILLRYPKIIAGKESEQIDKDLVYALKDILLSISSGLPMFTALNLASRGSYGYVSKDLKRVVDRVNTGIPMEDALEELAISTPSEHFQSALWQIINTSKSGADVEGVLRSLVGNLVVEQRSSIQKYSHELNVFSLMYMLVAVAIPMIVTTLMIILNTISTAGITEPMFIVMISLSFFIQIAIVGLIKSRRPVVHL